MNEMLFTSKTLKRLIIFLHLEAVVHDSSSVLYNWTCVVHANTKPKYVTPVTHIDYFGLSQGFN